MAPHVPWAFSTLLRIGLKESIDPKANAVHPSGQMGLLALGRLVVSRQTQGQGLGSILFADACKRVAATSETLAVAAIGFCRSKHKRHSPAMHRRVINEHASLLHHLLDVPKAQRIGHVPAHTAQLMARMSMLEWLQEKKIDPMLVKNFEDTLYKIYKPGI